VRLPPDLSLPPSFIYILLPSPSYTLNTHSLTLLHSHTHTHTLIQFPNSPPQHATISPYTTNSITIGVPNPRAPTLRPSRRGDSGANPMAIGGHDPRPSQGPGPSMPNRQASSDMHPLRRPSEAIRRPSEAQYSGFDPRMLDARPASHRRVMCVQLLIILAVRRRCRRRRCLRGVRARLDGWVRIILLMLLRISRLRLAACPLSPFLVPPALSTTVSATRIS
jgi:hypothetical protein